MGKKIKHMIILILTAGITLCSFTGCGNGGHGSSGKRVEGLKYRGQDVSEPVELTMYLIGEKAADFDKVYDEVNKILREKVNAVLNVKYLSWDKVDTNYSLLFSSGEDFDMIFTASGWGYYESTVAKNGFYAMDEEFRKTYAPDIQKLLPETAWEQASINGSVYMVPNYQHEYGMEVIGIRGDLMEKYHYQDITTPEDLEAFLQEIAKNEKGISPMGTRSGGDLAGYFLYPDGYPLMGGPMCLLFTYNINDQSDSRITYTVGTDDFMNYAKKMREFYTKGFWTSDTLSSANSRSDSWEQGQSAVMSWNIGTISRLAREMNVAHPDWKATFVDPLSSSVKQFNAYINNGVGINAASKNPERAMMVINELMTDKEVYDLTSLGIEGVHWEAAPDNTYKALADADKFPANGTCNWGWTNMNIRRNEYVENADPVYEKQMKTIEKWDAAAQEPHPYSTFSFNSEKVDIEVVNISNVMSKYFDPICAGLVDDPEKAVKELRIKLKKAGIEKVYQEIEKQTAEFWEKRHETK
ncbi:MAG: ABC transporter substrate-binding protein [Lachnospiraceae bacterium]|nr:ABC transporter substrate-binding protein [Lachnospiraceae bacterium]